MQRREDIMPTHTLATLVRMIHPLNKLMTTATRLQHLPTAVSHTGSSAKLSLLC